MKLKFLIISLLVCIGCSMGYAKKSALLIGIGSYNTESTGWDKIHGDNDVDLLTKKLKSKGFSVQSLKNSNATKKNILNALTKLVNTSKSGDIVYLHFSGHGQLIKDFNNDEKDDYDQSFVCYDACISPKLKLGKVAYKGQNHLIDDELFPYINNLKKKVGRNGSVMVIFDSCYSEDAVRGEIKDDPDPESSVEWMGSVRGSDVKFELNKTAENFLRKIPKPGQFSSSGGRVTVISACERDRRNYECKEKRSGKQYGSLSYSVGMLLDNDIPMGQWGDFFSDGRYKNLKVFRSTQHPQVQVYN